MSDIRVIAEVNGVKEVTDGKSTWKEYPPFDGGWMHLFETEVLFHPVKWYNKTLAFLFNWLVLMPLTIPIYQVLAIYFLSNLVGLGGWSGWEVGAKLVVLVVTWVLVIPLHLWAGGCSVGENGAFGPGDD